MVKKSAMTGINTGGPNSWRVPLTGNQTVSRQLSVHRNHETQAQTVTVRRGVDEPPEVPPSLVGSI